MRKVILQSRRIQSIVATFLCFVGAPATAEALAGPATIIDGDSLIVDGKEVRLFGIDAPELSQTCLKDAVAWECGEEAKRQLEALIADASVQCASQSVDTHGRELAVCFVGYDNLNERMVERGWAVAYRQYSSDYIASEMRAKASRAGIWGSSFDLPYAYRLAQNPPPDSPAPAGASSSKTRVTPDRDYGCVIKGNRNRKGQWIYHVPGMPYYAATKAEEIFCSEADARAAGYRRALVR